MDEEPTLGYRNKYYSQISNILDLCSALEENGKQLKPFSIVNT
jgi:hypothetical protein